MREIDKLALAAFLHDIGKFRQRAGFNDLSDYELGFLNKYKYVHAGHTAKALSEIGLDEIVELAASHHKTGLSGDELIIQKADRLASMLDRKESLEELQKDDFIKIAIETPFSFVYLTTPPKKYYYPLQKFENKIKISESKRINNQEEYEKLYKEFVEEFRNLNLKFNCVEDFLKVKSIYEKYATFIPASSYKTYPDVSLYDHSLSTAAIGVAIKKGDGENFSLIQGDFTSIQNFIFSKFGESNKFLAKILRAKSLFVNIATELIALRIVKELDLSVFNIVMNAGGKFTILAHKLTKEDEEKLKKIKEWVNKEFEKINYLQTKFIIKSIPFQKDSFKLGEFNKVFKDLAYEFEEEKLLFKPQKNVFENYIEEAKNGICEICGIVPLEDNEEKVCKYCKKFKEIGEKLPKAKYISFDLDDLLSIEINGQGAIKFYLDDYPLKRVANYVPIFSDKDDLRKYESIKEKDIEFKKGGIKSFYHIAQDGLKIENDELIGKNYLAILKADIDNLGEIFIRGFRKESTFSRILYLSRMIDYFFTNELMDFIKEKSIYTVFAGGDDLFLIGHYEDIVKTYEWIIKNFKSYTKNKDFHLSSAIHFTKPNIPLNLMSEFAEEDLEKAKNIDEKDAVTIFGISLKNDEFLEILELREFFEELFNDLNKLDAGVGALYKIYEFIDMQEHLNENILVNARWKYLLRYMIEKNFEIKKNDEKSEIKKRVKEKFFKISNLIEEKGEKLKIPLNLFLYSIRK